MGCCVALAYLFALARRAWFTVAPGAPVEPALFAPPAQRPEPGGAALAGGPSTATTIQQAPGARRPTAHALVVAGIAWFGLGLVGMHVFGWFGWAERSLLTDTAFHSSGLWLAAAGATMLAVRA